MVAPIESRIVQRAVHDVLMRVPSIRRYAENPYSFGGVKKRSGNDLGAVPAAIQAVLDAIRDGATYVIRSDISAFFTRIPKPTVTALVAEATREQAFLDLFERAIAVELENLSSLRERLSVFPIYEIGVAQGNSLSPLLGNLLLYDFDREMNSGACRCLRYIDDFIVLAPDRQTAERQFSHGLSLLLRHGLEVSTEKTLRANPSQGFEFLGIRLANGTIGPSKGSRRRLLANVSDVLKVGARALRSHRKTGALAPSFSLIRTPYEASSIVQAWGSHYFFCKEKNILRQLDEHLDIMLRQYLGVYRDARDTADRKGRRQLIGVPLLEGLASRPFIWQAAAARRHSEAMPVCLQTLAPLPSENSAPLTALPISVTE